MNYQDRLQDEIVRKLSKQPKKSAKIKQIAKLDKYHNRMKTGK